MPRTTQRKEGTYYDLNREARLRYQHERYAKIKDILKRSRDLNRFLDQDRHAQYLEYQRAYYAANRDRLRAQRKALRDRRKALARQNPT